MSIFFVSLLERVHSSELYKNTEEMSATNTLILILRDISFEQRTFLLLAKAALASCFLLFISSVFPSSEPSSLQFFQSVLPFRVTSNSSVLSSFTSRLFSLSFWGAFVFISSFEVSLVVAQLASSAYC